MEKAGITGQQQPTSAGTAPSEVTNDLLQRAFQQGVDYASQQQAEIDAALRQQRLEELQQANEEQEKILRERTEALRRREYRCTPPHRICLGDGIHQLPVIVRSRMAMP